MWLYAVQVGQETNADTLYMELRDDAAAQRACYGLYADEGLARLTEGIECASDPQVSV